LKCVVNDSKKITLFLRDWSNGKRKIRECEENKYYSLPCEAKSQARISS
jgi:hypothetical protein